MIKKFCRCPNGCCNELARRYRVGDAGAGNELARTHQGRIHSIAARILGPTRRMDWDDAAQTALFHGLLALPKWREDCPFCCFLASVAARKCIDYARGLDSHRFVPLTDEWHSGGVSEPADPELIVSFQREMQKFPEEYQQAWQLYLDDVPTADIACQLGLGERAVYYRLAAVRSRLARTLREFGAEIHRAEKNPLQDLAFAPSITGEADQ